MERIVIYVRHTTSNDDVDWLRLVRVHNWKNATDLMLHISGNGRSVKAVLE